MAKQGRPLKKSAPLDKNKGFRLTEVEFALVNQAIRVGNLNVTDTCRDVVVKKAKEILRKHGELK